MTLPSRKNIQILLSLVFMAIVNTSYSAAVQATLVESKTEIPAITAILFEVATTDLTAGNYSDREKTIKKLYTVDDERVLPVLQKMLKSKLYYIKKTKQLVFVEKADNGFKITSILNNEDLGVFEKNKLKRVKVNNKLRRLLRGYIAQLGLKSPDDAVRKAAVKQLLKNINTETIEVLQVLDKKETNSSIKELVAAGVLIWNLSSDDKVTQLASIKALSKSLVPEVKLKLQEIIEDTEDATIKKAAISSLKKIDSKISIFEFLENLVFGLSLGSVLLLIAVGLAITFGVMGVINMAHGELMMLGAYTTYVVQQMLPEHITASIFISIPLAFLVAGAFGVAIERFVIRYLYGRPLETLLATFGISLILQQLVRSVFGPTNQAVQTPAFMSGSLEINSIFAITYNRLYIFIFAIVVLLLLMLILKKTRLGLQVRAVSQNRTMAKAMGVKSEWVDAMTFGLGSGIAGVAGVALSQLTNVGPNLGQAYIIDSFMVVVFGGVGNLLGTFVGAMSLGVFNKFLEPWSGAVLAKILVLVFIILFIQKRPRGLFPKKGRGVED